MYPAKIITQLRTLIVMMMAVAFVVAPMSAAADTMHACDEGAVVCSEAGLIQNGSGEVPSHEGHDHTAHHCGGCHVHMMGGGNFIASLEPAVQTTRLRPGQSAHASLRPDGLYRPPRA